ncbi:MAG: cation diffusion facilitator family transporter [Candidatus Hydrogenedentes bacterium]|nr:cation diffusion facilitator family transporter [Candidatus Hydrogenedentota bacterium]
MSSHPHDHGHSHNHDEDHGHQHELGRAHDAGHEHEHTAENSHDPKPAPLGSHRHGGHHHGDGEGHGHTHGVMDPTIVSTTRGIWAIKWSFAGLALTALFQVIVVVFSGSVALLADTIHNAGDAATAVPLWIAFMFARLKPSRRFPYGLGRVEDLAGATVVMVILFSAIVAAYESVDRFLHPRSVEYLWAVVAASIVGFIGNEAVAVFRIKVGKEINSVALIADGYHARVDGWTSLAVLFGAVGVWLGFPLADPLVALGISIAIFVIVWQSAKAVLTRTLDGVEPEIMDEITHAVGHVKGVRSITDVKARWLGHKLRAEVGIEVDPDLHVSEAQNVSAEVQRELHHHLSYLSAAVVYTSVAAAPQATQ